MPYVNARNPNGTNSKQIEVYIIITGVSQTGIYYTYHWEYPRCWLAVDCYYNTLSVVHKGVKFQFYDLNRKNSHWVYFFAANDVLAREGLDKS